MSANDKSIAISSQDQSSFKRSVTIRTGLNALESIPSLRETESAAKTDLNISESISSLKRRVSLKKLRLVASLIFLPVFQMYLRSKDL